MVSLEISSPSNLFGSSLVYSGKCTATCDGGTASMEAFCRRLRAPAQIKALCWAAAYG